MTSRIPAVRGKTLRVRARRFTELVLLTTVCGAFLAATPVSAQDWTADRDTVLTAEGWAQFGKNVSDAIYEGNAGQRQTALRHIVQYGQYLRLDRELVFEVMRIYRNHKELRMRRLAVLALGNMNDRWAIEFLEMLEPYEEHPELKDTIRRVVAEYRATHQ